MGVVGGRVGGPRYRLLTAGTHSYTVGVSGWALGLPHDGKG